MPICMAADFLETMLNQSPDPALTKAELAMCRFMSFFYPPCAIGLQMYVGVIETWMTKELSSESIGNGVSFHSDYPSLQVLRLEPAHEAESEEVPGILDLLRAYHRQPPGGLVTKNDGNSLEIQMLYPSMEGTWN
ncbi:hypothetical protein ONS95_015067 [Cadophora gregata]|uniref:uncharacterized protein n=1 Tax=Cadophora gregata TaxID=51156 RepID=UPI0026DB972E|nr:uncharacterized protein ONS95_015067 [Cadophora gregata]KAK0101128.1 hypothetical protein ONS96_006353 [Cadophora gregata f. sp. sojae]KAK0115840.1 hypothetical protein ONS95_015067 [Cadophora gregata]